MKNKSKNKINKQSSDASLAAKSVYDETIDESEIHAFSY